MFNPWTIPGKACLRRNSSRQRRDAVMLVENVHEFPGHIACDSASMSEIVIPIHKDGEVIGVLDIDSPVIARFDEEDRTGLSGLVQTLELQLSKMMSITGV